ncbi:unnamed protein product [Lymnaea stagnalis]|uniref:Protein AF-10-like n=1 Tax=Lymnaea stagnalis TaxID=6523 RepID=A0AAV2H4C1_LYMST
MSKKVKEMIGGCCVCSDERGWNENPLVYCDGAGCSVAVHQACYGIVLVPTGPWFCKKCESQERVARVKCELCPQRAGALKRTDTGGWCHVVCALYIPEAGFGNVQTMEPILLSGVPNERFNKTCYICEEQKRDTKATAGACMQCNRNTCKQFFHVTCAQAQGLLCEVTGSYENVNYCGYCSHHYKKLKNQSNVKTIPAFKPIPSENGTPDSSPEKIVQNKTEGEIKPPSQPTIEQVKSPQVDQSVSSTSDSVPSQLLAYSKPDLVSPGCSQVSDITSAVSPSGEDLKSPQSGSDLSQEPSSSGVITQQKSIITKLLQDGGATSSTENIEVDVGGVTEEVKLNVDVLPVTSEETSQAMSKRQRQVNSQKPEKSAVKKTKSTTISSTVPHRKDGSKKAMKKRRDSGGSSTKGATTSSNTATTLPGHHNYCGSIFGGSPYFQSLSAPGRVSLSNFASHGLFPSLPYGGDNYLYATDSYYDSSALNGTPPLVQPPKQFPSIHTSKQGQDHSQDFPLSMEQLLEQQWDHGAQFLMDQGQHFDIASLLNCLHRLKGENQSLEDQVRDLTSRRNHLMAVNARLSLPLSVYDGCLSNSQSSSMGSLEDISSPDDVQPKSGLTTVQIPCNSDLIVEDILSPVDTEHPSLSNHKLTTSCSPGYYPDQICPPQPLMYSVVNPPPPTLSVISTTLPSRHTSTPAHASMSSHHTSALPHSAMPALEPSHIPNLSGLSLNNSNVTTLQDTT